LRVPQPLKLPSRQIHLDFHTSPFIPDVGCDFDAELFARTMKDAHVNSVTVFAKCHHGHLYYNTNRPERHPALAKDLNLLGQQVEALHRHGIRAPIYISLQCDEYAADHHPEWVAKDVEGKPVGAGPLAPGWQILDMSTPYQDYAYEQTQEVLSLFKPVDGVFFDMCWDQPSYTNWFLEQMIEAGLNPEHPGDVVKHSHTLAHQYMKRFYELVKSTSADASVYFNGRQYQYLPVEKEWQTQVEIEALPTGGWGYMYFPKNVRYARNFDRSYMGMTARFHKSWADFGGLKPYAALEYETSQMIAHGAKCSIGDQLHPRGTLDPAAYELIGKIYKRVEEREPWLSDVTPVAQIGLFHVTGKATGMFATVASGSGTEEGATRLLTQLKHQFNVINGNSDFGKYELVILPDSVQMTDELRARLSDYLKKGGAVLATGTSGLSDDGTKLLVDDLGVIPSGLSPFTTTYMQFGKRINQDVPPSEHVMYEKGVRVSPAVGATSLATVVEPYFERSWQHFSSHFQTPPDKPSKFSAATLNGRCAYIAYPIFSAFAKHGNYPYRLLVRNIIDLLIPEPLVRITAPTTTEVTVMKQSNRTIVHVLQYAPERRTEKLDIVEDIVPLHDVPMSVKLPSAPKSVYVAPERTPLKFEYANGRASVTIPRVNGHAMVVFE
jgi:hypothetical protein